MILILSLQFILPLILIVWIAIAPARNWLNFCLQVFSVASTLLAIGLAGLWTFLPWWTPHAFGCLLLIVSVLGLRRRQVITAVRPESTGG